MIEGVDGVPYPRFMPALLPSRTPRSKSGNAAIEFAFIAPLLVLLLSGIVELGLAVRTSYALQEGLLSGANQASHRGFDKTAISNAITSSSPTLAKATVSISSFCGCPEGNSISVIATCDTDPANPGSCPVACTAVCKSDGLTVRKYAMLSASVPRQSVFGQSFGLSPTLSSTMRTRLQ